MLGFTLGTERPQGATNGDQPRGAEGGDEAPMDRPHRSKVDVFLETGLTPREFIVETVDAHGGRLKQQALIEITGWSAGAISTLLMEMEDAGSIERIWVGREKVIYLPGAKPDRVAPQDPEES